MGRTAPTYREALEERLKRWDAFGRLLTDPEDKAAFERIRARDPSVHRPGDVRRAAPTSSSRSSSRRSSTSSGTSPNRVRRWAPMPMPGGSSTSPTPATGRASSCGSRSARAAASRSDRVPCRPPFLIDGPHARLVEVERTLADDPGVERPNGGRSARRSSSRRPRRVLAVTARANFARRRARRARSMPSGDTERSRSTTSTSPRRSSTTSPTASTRSRPSSGTRPRVRATEPAETIDYAPVPLRSVPFSIELAGVRRGGIVPESGTIASVRVGEASVRAESEAATLLEPWSRELARGPRPPPDRRRGRVRPARGSFERAGALGSREEAFFLGREPGSFRPSPLGLLLRELRADLPPRRGVPAPRPLPHRRAGLLPLRGRGRRGARRRGPALPALAADGRPPVARDLLHGDGDGPRPLRRRPRPVEEEPARGVQVARTAPRGRPGRRDLPAAGRRPRRGRRVRLRRASTRTSWSATTSRPRRSTADAARRAPRRPGPRLPVVHPARRADPEDARAADRAPARLQGAPEGARASRRRSASG